MLAESPVSVLGSAPGVLHAAGRGVPDALHRRDRQKLRIAHFTSLSGSAGIWGPPSVNSAILAAGEINRRGGILGREIELVIHDAGQAPEDLTRAAEDLVVSEDADVVMGCHMSAARMLLRRTFKGHLPYVYTPIYEGGERTPRTRVGDALSLEELERVHIRGVMANSPSLEAAARTLGIDVSTLYRKRKQYGM